MSTWRIRHHDREPVRPGRPAWMHRKVIAESESSELSAEWSLLHGHHFGWGLRFGRNGSESDVGLDVHAGRLGSIWTRLRAPWLKWVRVDRDKSPKDWHYARHTSLILHPRAGCLVSGEWDVLEGRSSRSDPWWRSWSITRTTILGRTRFTTTPTDSGATSVPMPEGDYIGTWTAETVTRRHVRWPGTWLDRVRPLVVRTIYRVDVAGGIPVEGKGESDYDCGMDGVFSSSGGATLGETLDRMVRGILRDRERYGGPHNLPRPMTVAEASERHRA